MARLTAKQPEKCSFKSLLKDLDSIEDRDGP